MNYKRGANWQLAINMSASIVAFIVNFGINFFLTPYIVKSLGAAAYGFVGLSNNLISYTQLLTIALNSMAGRFITIKYTQGKIDEANRYFSSVFYSNLILSVFILLAMGGCIVFLEYIFDVPENLIFDVKLLFTLLVFNSVFGLMSNIYAIATFIKNRLELSSIRSIIGYIIRALSLLVLFGFFPSHLWFVGIGGVLYTIYSGYTNYKYTRYLTPELKVERAFFDITKVKELIVSGIWNLFTKLGELLGQGLDLVVVNLFIGATAMGFFSLTKSVPMFILQLFSMIAAVFAPTLTRFYAEKKSKELNAELIKSIRILGFVSTMPMVCLYCYGLEFYELWLPTQNATHLQILTVLGTIGFVFSMPLEGLWNIFTITNKLKYCTYFLLWQNLTSFVVICFCLFFVEDDFLKLCTFNIVRLLFSFTKNFGFLPLYGAKCLNLHWKTFFPPLFKTSVCFGLSMSLCFIIRLVFKVHSWGTFILGVIICCIICVIVNSFVILNKGDRQFILSKVNKFIKLG